MSSDHSKYLWKTIPKQESTFSNPSSLVPILKKTNRQQFSVEDHPIQLQSSKSETIYDMNGLQQTARFASQSLEEFARSNQLEEIIKQIFFDNCKSKNNPLIWSFNFGNNLMLSITKKQEVISKQDLLDKAKADIKSLRDNITAIFGHVSSYGLNLAQLSNRFMEEIKNIASKNQMMNLEIEELKEQIKTEKQICNILRNNNKSIYDDLENVIGQFQKKQNQVNQLQLELSQKNKQNQNLKTQLKQLSEQKDKMQESMFGHKQKCAQFDIQLEQRVREIISSSEKYLQPKQIKEKGWKINRDSNVAQPDFYETTHLYDFDPKKSQEGLKTFPRVNYHDNQFNFSRRQNDPKLSDKIHVQISRKPYTFSKVTQVNPQPQLHSFKRFWSPKNEQSAFKLRTMHHKIFGGVHEEKQIEKKSSFQSNTSRNLVSLQNKLSALKSQIQKEIDYVQ